MQPIPTFSGFNTFNDQPGNIAGTLGFFSTSYEAQKFNGRPGDYQRPPQVDGPTDREEVLKNSEERVFAARQRVYQSDGDVLEMSDEDLLGSDLDDEEVEEIGEESTEGNYVLCQYDKVTRSRNRWRILLSSALARFNNVDVAFSRGSCEFEW